MRCSANKSLTHTLHRDDDMWRQRYYISWLKEGDRNTTSFHKAANGRKRSNEITVLTGDMDPFAERDALVHHITEHF